MKTERYIDMKSPLTGGRVKLVEDIEEQEFRNEKFSVHVRYCVCEDTGEQFSLEGQDDLVLNQIYGQYRIKHGIPFADEIVSIRERYGLNYTQISKITGFGTNQWKQYEQGVVPSESNGKMIAAMSKKQCMLDLLESSRSEFQDSEYVKIHARISAAPELPKFNPEQQLFYGQTKRGLYNGYSEMNVAKLKDMVRFLIQKECGYVCPTKLNKEMFYADFLHFRKYGKSISGLHYRAIQYGPVPEHFDTIYDNIEGVSKSIIIANDCESVRLHYDIEDQQITALTKEEIDTLTEISSILQPKRTSEVIEMSHNETAWSNNEQTHSFIPYSEAFNLKAI